MTRHVKRGGQIWIRVFPDKSITKKPAETRMGSGKGNPEGWVAVVKPGRMLFEMGGVTPEVAKEAMKLAASKLPIKTRFVHVRVGRRRRGEMKVDELRSLEADELAGSPRTSRRRSSTSCGSSTPSDSSRTRARSARSATTSPAS